MTAIRTEILNKLWKGADPFAGFPRKLYEFDLQGWNSEHAYLGQSIQPGAKPLIVVEIGVWKGGSAITLAKKIKASAVNGVLIAVDTWLGSWDHWLNDDLIEHLGMENGRPSMQKKFMNNAVLSGVADIVIPLPLDSVNAFHVLRGRAIRPDIVHVDGGHDYQAVTLDLTLWWDLLLPGGLLIGDDYHDTHWPEVRRAFDDFFGAKGLSPVEHTDGKCRIRKPPG